VILLDTDICVEILKGNKKILQRRADYDGPIGICFMTIAELYYGAEKSRDPTRNYETIEKLVLTLEIVQSDLGILRRFGAIKAQLQRDGTSLADADVLIAAATLERAERLITENKKHFERIPGLSLEDWR
jgi:tRNA(fMet)-specific endonuclease VapC